MMMIKEEKNKDTIEILIQVTKKIGEAIHEGLREGVPGKDVFGNPKKLSEYQVSYIIKWSLIGISAWFLCHLFSMILSDPLSNSDSRIRDIPFEHGTSCASFEPEPMPGPSPLTRSQAIQLRPDPK
jgi:hypothetical protein